MLSVTGAVFLPQECQLMWHFDDFPAWSLFGYPPMMVTSGRVIANGAGGLRIEAWRFFERASGSVLHDRSDDCETIMVPHPAQLLEPELSGDASRVAAICSGLSLKARANLIALLGDFLNVAANRDLLCPEFQNGCCPNISYEPLNRLFSQLRQEEAARSTVSGGLRTPRCRPPRN